MRIPVLLLFFLLLFSCKKEENNTDLPEQILIDSASVNGNPVQNGERVQDINFNSVEVKLWFRTKVDTTKFNRQKLFFTGNVDTIYTYVFDQNSRSLTIKPAVKIEALKLYRMVLDVGPNMGGTILSGFAFTFSTSLDTTPKFPDISNDSLLTLVQKKTFGYFWDHAHPGSGMIRERFGSGEIVTTGGTGFGMMAILVGIERRFITRDQGFGRLSKIANFLNNPGTDKFHGAFPHWMNGTTGKVYPFSALDNGGDLVETAFLMQGLLSVNEYFKNGTPAEKALCDTIQKIWRSVDWNWYRNDNRNRLYWHWSPNFNWSMNMTVSGWNEALIVYVLAAASPTHPIPKSVYDEGWARNGAYPMKNGKFFYGIQLPLGEDYGGPLFFAHYSFLGLDPRNLSDNYASYWTQNTSHTQINYEYCKLNPRNYSGYSYKCWGLTASDTPTGYSASSPRNDLGVIAPTAALSSFPYTPVESMAALKFFYYTLGDKIWGEYGFYDGFSISALWFATSYLAIDQGPIVCMIENYRSGMLWDLFMENTDIKKGLDNLEFTYN